VPDRHGCALSRTWDGRSRSAWPPAAFCDVEVLRLLAVGTSNPAIAEALVISPNTVLGYVTHIFQKTATAIRAEATGFAHRHGLLD
jgi:DNA-binding CsgD family transcriptional regulator